MKHFISLKYFSKHKIGEFIETIGKIKKSPSQYKNALGAKYIGLLFQKPSLRTKTSFYIGGLQLGAKVIYYSPEEIKLGQREKISDVAQTLACYLDGVVLRTFAHKVIEEFAKNQGLSVINGLSDTVHPSQILGDLFTLYEVKGDIRKIKVGYIGDGNNVCNSLLYAFSILGGNLAIASPRGYQPHKSIVAESTKLARKSGAKISVLSNVKQCAQGADVLYTDVWTSMGKEREAKKRQKAFKGFTIDAGVLRLADKDCIVMHCLPAHRGEEITDSVLDGKHSVVFLQAQNRLHSAKAILLYTLGQMRT